MGKLVFLIQTVRSWEKMYNFGVNLFQISFTYSEELLPLNTDFPYTLFYIYPFTSHTARRKK